MRQRKRAEREREREREREEREANALERRLARSKSGPRIVRAIDHKVNEKVWILQG